MFAAIVIINARGFLDGAELKLGEGAGVSRTDYGDLPSGGGGRFGGDRCHGGCVFRVGFVLLGSSGQRKGSNRSRYDRYLIA